MKQRLLVAAVGVPLLIVVLVLLPPIATAILTAAIAGAAVEKAVEKVVDVVKARKGVPLVQLVQMLCDSGRVSSARVNAVVLEALQEEAAVRRGVSVCGFECNVLLM